VFPFLAERNIQGCFFPAAQAVLEHKILDVNKIHFVLASSQNHSRLLERICELIAEFRDQYVFKTKEEYMNDLDANHRFDTREVTVIKRLLQRELAPPVRTAIIRRLFAEYVTTDETAFAADLYMSLDQIACLHQHGMHIGSHGFSHAWLDQLSPSDQAMEVDSSLKFLQKLGVAPNAWTMCYPYGGYNESLLNVLRERRCQLGFSVAARVADLDADDRLTLPRVDTNDLPS
jgi:peptidoglycan/xylan/chitin deacetylase (PgdA/CDA1 family)